MAWEHGGLGARGKNETRSLISVIPGRATCHSIASGDTLEDDGKRGPGIQHLQGTKALAQRAQLVRHPVLRSLGEGKTGRKALATAEGGSLVGRLSRWVAQRKA